MSDSKTYAIEQWSVIAQVWKTFPGTYATWFQAFSASKEMHLSWDLEISGNKNLPLPKTYWLGAWIKEKGKSWWRIVSV